MLRLTVPTETEAITLRPIAGGRAAELGSSAVGWRLNVLKSHPGVIEDWATIQSDDGKQAEAAASRSIGVLGEDATAGDEIAIVDSVL